MDEASQNRDGNGNPSHCSIAWVLDIGCLQHSDCKADAVSSHVSQGDKGHAEQASTQLDGVSPVGWLAVDILKIIEITATSRDALFNAINNVTWNVESVLDVDVSSRDAIDDAGKP